MSRAAEEEGFSLEAALPPDDGEGREDVVDFGVHHLALHLQPAGRDGTPEVFGRFAPAGEMLLECFDIEEMALRKSFLVIVGS